MIDTNESSLWFGINILRQTAVLGRKVQADMHSTKITKEDLSPVTVADFAIQALCAQALKKTFPEDVLVGEETANDLKSPERAATLAATTRYLSELIPSVTPEEVCYWIDFGAGEPCERFWTLDPVDGTKGYLRGGHYATALALIQDGRVTLGLLACPNLNVECETEVNGEGALLFARRGAGAWITSLSKASAEIKPLHVSNTEEPKLARMMRSVESGHTNIGEIENITKILGAEAPPVQMDSQAKYAVLAAGGAELLMRLLSPGKETYKERIWDQAAGSIILEEAGGRITDLYGKDLDFGQGRTLANNTGIFASNGPLHQAALDAITYVCRLP